MSGDRFTRGYSIVADTRRRWSAEEKKAIVAEAAVPGTNVSAKARRHGIKPSLLFRWRRKAREAGRAQRNEPVFLPVAVTAISENDELATDAAANKPPPSSSPAAPHYFGDNRIEIELQNGRRVRVDADVGAGALKRILSVLERL